MSDERCDICGRAAISDRTVVGPDECCVLWRGSDKEGCLRLGLHRAETERDSWKQGAKELQASLASERATVERMRGALEELRGLTGWKESPLSSNRVVDVSRVQEIVDEALAAPVPATGAAPAVTPPAICTHPSFDVDGICRSCSDKVALAFPVEFAKRMAAIDRGEWPGPAPTVTPRALDRQTLGACEVAVEALARHAMGCDCAECIHVRKAVARIRALSFASPSSTTPPERK